MNLSVDKMLELARKVYREKEWWLVHGTVVTQTGLEFPESIIFHPDLNGSERQQAQACRVIVAAFALGTDACITRDAMQKYSFYAENWRGDIVILTDQCPDLLQAAISALLGKEA